MIFDYSALLNQDMNLQFTGMTRRRDVALLRLQLFGIELQKCIHT
jgi:hypothetical protein